MDSESRRGTFDGQVAVITGAGRGIGRVTALSFARAGAAVVLAARTSAQIEAVSEEIEAEGGKTLTVVTDVTREDEVIHLAQRSLEHFGGVDVLVNNAGGGHGRTRLVDLTVEMWEDTFALNCRGTFLCCKHFVPPMIERRGGCIVNVGSASVRGGRAMLSGYSSAKYAVIGITQSLALEVGEYGIRVNAILPGTILTEGMPGYFERVARERGISVQEAEAIFVERSPMKRVLKPEEIADAILFMASDAARGMHGHCMDVNAGAWRH